MNMSEHLPFCVTQHLSELIGNIRMLPKFIYFLGSILNINLANLFIHK